MNEKEAVTPVLSLCNSPFLYFSSLSSSSYCITVADKYIDLVGMNTANGAQAQIWNYVAGGNQEWMLERIDPDVAQTGKRAGEAKDPQPTPSQRKHQNDLVRKLNSAGKGRAGRKA